MELMQLMQLQEYIDFNGLRLSPSLSHYYEILVEKVAQEILASKFNVYFWLLDAISAAGYFFIPLIWKRFWQLIQKKS